MGSDRPVAPGRRIGNVGWAGREVELVADAFNEMLERLENERRESARRALAAQEGERLRVARELHDELGQTLTAVALRAESAADGDGADGRAAARSPRRCSRAWTRCGGSPASFGRKHWTISASSTL